MIWALRVLVGLAVAAYAGWLGWPLVQTVIEGGTPAAVWRSVADVALSPEASTVGPWIGAAVLYGVSGVLTAVGVSWAPGVYFLAFFGEILLRLGLFGREASAYGADVSARTAEALAPLGIVADPAPLAFGTLLAVGLCVLALGLWRGQKGGALTASWTQAPVWN